MNSYEEFELVIDYIENNLNNVDIAIISKLTGIPEGLYQRIFSYICGVSISEYIRKRRLTEAACEILQNSESIIDIAMSYGYESHSGFTRAFKDQFGVPPTSLTSDILKACSYRRFSFQKDNDTYYVMKGRRIMADLVKIEYVEMEERKLIGISKSVTGLGGPELWDMYFGGGFSEKLGLLEDCQCEDMTEDYIGLGYATDFRDDKSLGNEYIVGRYFKPETSVPENMISIMIPKGIVANAQIRGKNLDDIINNSYILINDMVQKNGYRIDYNNFYWSEVYTYKRYCNPANSGAEELILDWYMPCIKEKNIDMLSEISATEHYDNLIDENNDPVFDSMPLQEYMNKWDGDRFLDELGINQESTVLEIGVGTGRLALKVLQQGCKYFVGVDLSEKTVNRAIENLKRYSNYSLIVGDFLTVEFNETYDVIYSSLTFSHIEDKVSAIKKIGMLLNSNGRFVLSIDKSQLDYLDYQKYKVKLYPDDLKQTVAVLEECGFNIINVIEIEFAYIITATR